MKRLFKPGNIVKNLYDEIAFITKVNDISCTLYYLDQPHLPISYSFQIMQNEFKLVQR